MPGSEIAFPAEPCRPSQRTASLAAQLAKKAATTSGHKAKDYIEWTKRSKENWLHKFVGKFITTIWLK